MFGLLKLNVVSTNVMNVACAKLVKITSMGPFLKSECEKIVILSLRECAKAHLLDILKSQNQIKFLFCR